MEVRPGAVEAGMRELVPKPVGAGAEAIHRTVAFVPSFLQQAWYKPGSSPGTGSVRAVKADVPAVAGKRGGRKRLSLEKGLGSYLIQGVDSSSQFACRPPSPPTQVTVWPAWLLRRAAGS